MSDPLRYQSPIALSFDDIIPITHQDLGTRGKNRGAVYIPETHIFEVKNKIILYIDDKKYRLMEYHFHAPGEHTINGAAYKAEIHYVFYEVTDTNDTRELFNVCAGENPKDDNIVILARVINNNPKDMTCFERIQVKLPLVYFEYDGIVVKTSETDENTDTEEEDTETVAEITKTVPIRWIVGKCPLTLLIREVENVAKPSRSTQPLDNRIVLYSC